MAPASFVTCERAAGYRLLTGGRAAPRILKRTLRPEIESELVPVPRLPSPAGSWRQRLLLPLAFTGGLASLGIEFAAARLLAPFFGQSLFIWGTLIGLILIYLTIGYYAGGRLADRRPDARGRAERFRPGLGAACSGRADLGHRPVCGAGQPARSGLSRREQASH